MSTPQMFYADRAHGARSEVVAAMSALNMEPRPLEAPEGDFLSERDHWAKHAVEHLRAAMAQLSGEQNPVFTYTTMRDFASAVDAMRTAAIFNDVEVPEDGAAAYHWLTAISLLEQAKYAMELACLASKN
jgi:hypothetical protein